MARSSAGPAAPDVPEQLAVWDAGGRPADGDVLDGVLLDDVRWTGLEVRGLRLDGAALRCGDLTAASLHDPFLRDVRFDGTNLANATVRGGELERVALADCRLTGITVAEAALRHIDASGCGADMAGLRRCRLEHARFDACRMREADFAGAILEDVSFTDLTGATFDRVQCTPRQLPPLPDGGLGGPRAPARGGHGRRAGDGPGAGAGGRAGDQPAGRVGALMVDSMAACGLGGREPSSARIKGGPISGISARRQVSLAWRRSEGSAITQAPKRRTPRCADSRPQAHHS